MKGELVPLVMIPRFTSYLGEGTYTTIPVAVSDYKRASIEFWRGTLVGTAGGATTFAAYFEEANQPDPSTGWSPISVPGISFPLTLVDRSDLLGLVFTKGYFRIRVVLATSDDDNNLAGITCWAAGVLEKRVPLEGGSQ